MIFCRPSADSRKSVTGFHRISLCCRLCRRFSALHSASLQFILVFDALLHRESLQSCAAPVPGRRLQDETRLADCDGEEAGIGVSETLGLCSISITFRPPSSKPPPSAHCLELSLPRIRTGSERNWFSGPRSISSRIVHRACCLYVRASMCWTKWWDGGGHRRRRRRRSCTETEMETGMAMMAMRTANCRSGAFRNWT